MTVTEKKAKIGPSSRPVLRREIEVKSELARRLLTPGLGFWKLTSAMYRIEVVWRMVSDSEKVDLTETAVKDYLKKVKEEVTQERDRLKLLLDQNGVVEIPDYTRKEAIRVDVRSPFINAYMGLIQALDEMIQYLDALWLSELISNSERKRKLLYWISCLKKLRLNIRNADKRLRSVISQEKTSALPMNRADTSSSEAEDEPRPIKPLLTT